LNLGVKESPDKVSIGTVEKLTTENMGIAFGILALGGTEPEIHLGVIYPPITTYVLKNTIATLGLIIFMVKTSQLTTKCKIDC